MTRPTGPRWADMVAGVRGLWARQFPAGVVVGSGGLVLLGVGGWALVDRGPLPGSEECVSMSVSDCVWVAAGLLDDTRLLRAGVVAGVFVALAVAARAVVLARRAAGAVRALRRAPVMPPRLADAMARGGLLEVTVLSGDGPVAFCAGAWRPRLYISTAAVAVLAADELDAVLAHELAHARRRDPLRGLLGRAGADVLFFVPVARWWHEHRAVTAELAADRAAVAHAGTSALAGALLGLADSGPAPVATAAFGAETRPAHPTLDVRIAALSGQPRPRPFRRAPLSASAAVLTGGLLSSGHHLTEAPPGQQRLAFATSCAFRCGGTPRPTYASDRAVPLEDPQAQSGSPGRAAPSAGRPSTGAPSDKRCGRFARRAQAGRCPQGARGLASRDRRRRRSRPARRRLPRLRGSALPSAACFEYTKFSGATKLETRHRGPLGGSPKQRRRREIGATPSRGPYGRGPRRLTRSSDTGRLRGGDGRDRPTASDEDPGAFVVSVAVELGSDGPQDAVDALQASPGAMNRCRDK